jgi:polyisoprenoid-binding protein YceI
MSWDPEADRRRLECLHVGPAEIRPGDRVRLRPRARADILDLALAGKTATVEAIEQDYEGRAYLAVTVDDDPGKDLGLLRQPGHRFFFAPEEIEPLSLLSFSRDPQGSASLRHRATLNQDSAGRPMIPLYRIDPGNSRLTVQAFAGGLLSFLAHSPTFDVRQFTGELRWRPDTAAGAALDVTVRADSLELLDKVRPADREDIMGRMRREVLDVAAYPEIHYHADEVATVSADGNRHRVRIAGELSLHGVTNRHTFEAEFLLFDDGVRLGGEFPLRLSDYRIPPVTALGGSIRLQDRLRVSFDVAAWKEA